MEFEKSFTTVKTAKGIRHINEDEAIKIYEDYINNFLTISAISEHYEIAYSSMSGLLKKVKFTKIV